MEWSRKLQNISHLFVCFQIKIIAMTEAERNYTNFFTS